MIVENGDKIMIQPSFQHESFNYLNIDPKDLPLDEFGSNRYMLFWYEDKDGKLKSKIVNVKQNSEHSDRLLYLNKGNWTAYQLFSVIGGKLSGFSSKIFKNE